MALLKKSLVAAVLVLVTGCLASSRESSSRSTSEGFHQGENRIVERVIDGDTLVVRDGERVRLIGIDTPEVDQNACFAAQARAFLGTLVPIGTVVRLVHDVEPADQFGRTLAYVYRLPDGLFVNAELMQAGYAQILTRPPNVAHAEEFLALQSEARTAGRGLWAACDTEARPR